MTLVQLDYIIAVNKYRHFISAADSCHVTQPTLSMQIKKLEEELGIIIFDRNKHPIEPTEIGKKIIEQAYSVIKGTDRIVDIIANTRDNISGDLKIGIIPTIASYLVPLFIPQMAKKYPDLNIFVEEMMTHKVVENLNAGFIDMGIVSTPLSEVGIEEHSIYYEPFVLYVSKDHKLYKKDKISSRDLKINEMWLLSDGNCFRNHVINLCDNDDYFSQNLRFGYKTSSIEVLMKLVDQNEGYTLVPYLATFDASKEQRTNFRLFKEPTPKREISIITPKGYLKNKLLKTISSEIQKSIPKELVYLDKGKIINWKI